jgi:hypothetical protein
MLSTNKTSNLITLFIVTKAHQLFNTALPMLVLKLSSSLSLKSRDLDPDK